MEPQWPKTSKHSSYRIKRRLKVGRLLRRLVLVVVPGFDVPPDDAVVVVVVKVQVNVVHVAETFVDLF